MAPFGNYAQMELHTISSGKPVPTLGVRPGSEAKSSVMLKCSVDVSNWKNWSDPFHGFRRLAVPLIAGSVTPLGTSVMVDDPCLFDR
jgi:hypothetical protein